jgi:hypothetical protein
LRPLVLATSLLLGLLLTLATAGRLFGSEPRSAWICDDTRYTQLVPKGRTVVGAPVTPPPGCAP